MFLEKCFFFWEESRERFCFFDFVMFEDESFWEFFLKINFFMIFFFMDGIFNK